MNKDFSPLVSLVEKLYKNHSLDKTEYCKLLNCPPATTDEGKQIWESLSSLARKQTEQIFGENIFIRGLIEFSNYCKNNCYYCGIRKGNLNAKRYRLTEEQIFSCCKQGYGLGFRTFVLQSGEDLYFSKEKIVSIIEKIKETFPDCAVTLSIGEKTFEEYAAYKKAGADRFLLRHETADILHYEKIKPPELKFDNRMKCLSWLKELGFQVGCGFMVGSPYQTTESIVQDLLFIEKFKPQMIGIGPFIPHHQTPFSSFPSGSVDLTLLLISILRLINPHVLLPATTALGTADSDGREKGILCGANVVMPNLSPQNVRKEYQLYDNKICTGCESAQSLSMLASQLKKINRNIIVDKGDYIEQY